MGSVDGAWVKNKSGLHTKGIGGFSKNGDGKICYMLSDPIWVTNSVAAE